MTCREISIGAEAPVSADPGPKPVLSWLALADLVIDDSYQRPIDEGGWLRIRRIAAAFHWSKFSPMMVAPLDGGRFAVIDGQHRAHAAMLCGIRTVPALIAPAAPSAQAGAFVAVNGTAAPLNRIALYRAALVAGEEWALTIQRVVRAAGLEAATSSPSGNARRPWVIYSIGTIRRFTDAGHGSVVTDALSALRDYDRVGRVALYSDYILQPWLKAVTGCPAPVTVLSDVLERRDPFKVVEAAQREIAGSGAPYQPVAVSIWQAMIRSRMGGRA